MMMLVRLHVYFCRQNCPAFHFFRGDLPAIELQFPQLSFQRPDVRARVHQRAQHHVPAYPRKTVKIRSLHSIFSSSTAVLRIASTSWLLTCRLSTPSNYNVILRPECRCRAEESAFPGRTAHGTNTSVSAAPAEIEFKILCCAQNTVKSGLIVD